MNKDYLEALENMKNGASDWYGSYELCEDYPVVKSALERLKSIDNSNPSKVLEVFKEFKKILLENVVLLDTDLQRLNTIEQSLLKEQEQEKVLKLIFKKQVDINEIKILLTNLKHCDDAERCKRYNISRKVGYKLKFEEFDLIKEWIECLKNLKP